MAHPVCWKKCLATPLNLWIQLFTVPKVIRITHLAMQSAFTKICERMDLLKELSIGAWYCNKILIIRSIIISLWRFLPPRYSTIKWNGIIAKLKPWWNQGNSAMKLQSRVAKSQCSEDSLTGNFKTSGIYSNTKNALGASYHGFPWLSISCSINVDMDQYIGHIFQSKVYIFKELL